MHYLLEPGWKADTAIQGLGRTNRTNQAQPPLFRPIATDVKAEKRFFSTIARRLDTLGAITRGQRQTGGQGLFRPEDNLESPYVRAALRQLYLLLMRGKVEGCSLERFEVATELRLMDLNGLKDDLPPITTFLNRLPALTIDLQGVLFTAFEQLLEAKVAGAIVAGIYDLGLETLKAESFTVTDRQVIHTHPGTGAETRLLTITERRRNRPLLLDAALEELDDPKAVLLINSRSGRAAVQVPTRSALRRRHKATTQSRPRIGTRLTNRRSPYSPRRSSAVKVSVIWRLSSMPAAARSWAMRYRSAAGHSKLDAIRALKRYIAREVFNVIARRQKEISQTRSAA